MRETAVQNGRNNTLVSQNCCVNVLNKHSKIIVRLLEIQKQHPQMGKIFFLITNASIFIILSDSKKLNLVTSRKTQSK